MRTYLSLWTKLALAGAYESVSCLFQALDLHLQHFDCIQACIAKQARLLLLGGFLTILRHFREMAEAKLVVLKNCWLWIFCLSSSKFGSGGFDLRLRTSMLQLAWLSEEAIVTWPHYASMVELSVRNEGFKLNMKTHNFTVTYSMLVAVERERGRTSLF